MTLSNKTRKWLVISWLIILSSVVALLFWRNEWKYSLPTPIPVNYHNIALGAPIGLPPAVQTSAKPLFLHFFNPDCPCSRFNMPQFKALVDQYGDRVDFAIVVMSPKSFTASAIRNKFNLAHPLPVLQDSSVAAACGVYSTPQAV